MVEPQSIVHWFPEKDTHKCGYCKNTSGSVHFGMWAQRLTVEDYQSLIDRGWRRSGQYCYKPVMDETCCPLYTIRCDVLNFHPSKSQKKVIKKLNKFLKCGVGKTKENVQLEKSSSETFIEEGEGIMENVREFSDRKVSDFSKIQTENEVDHLDVHSTISPNCNTENRSVEHLSETSVAGISNFSQSTSIQSTSIKKGIGADPTKPPCKKAKVLRLEKKLKKMEKSGRTMDISNTIPKQQQGKGLEELINEVSADDELKLTTRLIEPTNSSGEWKKYQQLEFELYRKYQNIIHNDPPDKNKMDTFMKFLVNTPLEGQRPKGSSSGHSYGSFHQQYWLGDKLIAVGVIDILPKCVSAVYFFYDPDYRELTLGTYGALKEIQLARELYPHLKTEFYYMGYYIHTCKKMRYKGNMTPSFLLCPETYEWFPIQECIHKLEKNKYCRFNGDIDAVDENECTSKDLDDMKIVIGNRFMNYGKFKRFYGQKDDYINVGRLVGKICAKTLFFVE